MQSTQVKIKKKASIRACIGTIVTIGRTATQNTQPILLVHPVDHQFHAEPDRMQCVNRVPQEEEDIVKM